jgi:hypothetical protein
MSICRPVRQGMMVKVRDKDTTGTPLLRTVTV